MILTPQYGYRSACCNAPIRLGKKKVKNTNVKVDIWICCKCSKRDVSLVEYTKGVATRSTQTKHSFTPLDTDSDTI